MKNLKIVLLITVCVLIAVPQVALALETTNSLSVEDIYASIKENIVNDYSGIYDLANFTYDYSIRHDNNEEFIDINIYTDMTLTRPASKSPFIKGMQKALKDTNNKEYEGYINNYIALINENYLVPNSSTFTYSARVLADGSYKLYYRNDTVLIDVENLAPVEDKATAIQQGYNRLISDINNKNEDFSLMSSFTYDRLAARNWARNNAYAAQEYPSSTVNGSDCANFVSKALHDGGIPEDKAGKWYGSTTWGGWSGINWMRTGYNNNGGVVTYMTDKGYFYKQTDESKVFAGSIMYWKTTSHVALVTYGDGTAIKYTQHGATQSKDTVYRDANTLPTISVKFYMPSSSIMD